MTQALKRRRFLLTAMATPLVAAMTNRSRAARAAERVKFNASIDASWQAGLDVLKPSQVELDRGLGLHAESLVFDCYGFAPRCAVDGEVIAQAVAAGASDEELQDLREEMGMTRCVTNEQERDEFELAWRAAGVTCIFQNAGEEGQNPIRLLKRLGRFTYLTDHLREFLFKAVTPADIEQAKKDGKHCLYFTGNGVPIAGEFNSVPDELRHIKLFFQLGIRMMHVTYNRRNLLGDGCAEPANGGLSDLGRAAVAEMNRVGVIVDVAHSGWRTSLEAAQASKLPMVASHTACDAVNHHIRAKPVEVIKAICDGGGLIGICCIPAFLGGNGDIPALIEHIDYVAKRFGTQHVGIGTDIAYTSSLSFPATRQIPPRGPRRTRYEAFWPEGALGKRFPGEKSLAWTNWPLFTVGLVQRGYRDEDIRLILGQNMLRVSRELLKSRAAN
ncbi:Membrane dipeptidase (Peptidase family M19) [Anatilimnocola aggregata]|uniref:Membrane dipeptidase (Peptidase family M19) n=1 Tax=Anatilimnocola aggregata TaxID=2528021 RepID=A0A517YJF9_9BACT|nr:membrane dipeptidase [Anatilimnocola aggregata]QDU30356.1 Membrane dipeptidase (Peptidase family M19) [Anatilimnocola aggregata]